MSNQFPNFVTEGCNLWRYVHVDGRPVMSFRPMKPGFRIPLHPSYTQPEDGDVGADVVCGEPIVAENQADNVAAVDPNKEYEDRAYFDNLVDKDDTMSTKAASVPQPEKVSELQSDVNEFAYIDPAKEYEHRAFFDNYRQLSRDYRKTPEGRAAEKAKKAAKGKPSNETTNSL